MQKVSRSIFAGLLVLAGLTACGDKVTVTGNQQSSSAATPVVHSVTVAPANVNLGIGQTVQLVATVDADAGLARTVTWASGDATKATVSSSGLVTAVTSGTVVITATSTADNTVAGAATIIVAPVTNATISINSITDSVGNVANLNNVKGQLNVTLNVDQGTQTVSELDLIVHNNAANTDTTVAKYMFTSSNKASSKASATSAPITMSFSTAAYNDTTGAVAFKNGSYSIKAQAVVAGSSGQSPVSSTMNYTVGNTDFMLANAHGDSVATDNTGRQWTSGNVTVRVVPVLYSGRTLMQAVVNAPAAFVNTKPDTLTTFPDSAVFAVGKDTLTDSSYVAFVNARYSDATQFNGGAAVNANQIRVDNAAPQMAAVFAIGDTISGALGATKLVPWVNGVYKFSSGLAMVVDSSTVAGSGLGVGGITTKYYAIPNGATAADTALTGGSASGWTACTVPSNAIMASTGADITVQSLPGDTTTYLGRAVSSDKLGNVVCQDLSYNNTAGNAVSVFGVDNGAPINAGLTAASAQDGDVGATAGAVGAWQWVLQDSISGFATIALPTSSPINGTIIRNYVSNQAAMCVGGTWDATHKVCKTVPFGQNTAVDNGDGNNGYFTLASTVSDIAGNSATVPTATVLVDNVAPAAGTAGSIPNAIGGSAVTYTGTVTDNVDLVGSYGYIGYPAGYNLVYTTAISPSHAAFSGTRDTVGTVSLTVDSSFISSLAVTSAGDAPQSTALGAGTHPTTVQLNGVDGNNQMGGDAIAPTVTDTTGAEVWAPSMFATFAENNAAKALSNGTGTGTRSVTLTAQVTGATAALGVPFQKVCWYYADTNGNYVMIGCQNLAVATQQPGGTNTWDWTGPTFDPPSSLGTAGAVNIIAIGIGHGGSALATQVTNAITLQP